VRAVPRSLSTARHVAHLHDVAGEGLLVLPLRSDDAAEGSDGDRVTAMRELRRLGWEPSEDEHGDLYRIGRTTDGRDVVVLSARSRARRVSERELALARAELRKASGMDGD
jgi:hypothetical protein